MLVFICCAKKQTRRQFFLFLFVVLQLFINICHFVCLCWIVRFCLFINCGRAFLRARARFVYFLCGCTRF